MMQKSVSKINLHLKVTNKRPDGYHELESIFLPLDQPADMMSIKPADRGLALTCSKDTIPTDQRNICHQAVEWFAKFAKTEKQVEISTDWSIHIDKVIPVAAGLGGGSSNAAVVLQFLNGHYKLFNQEEMIELATSIGADVPFFLAAKPAVVTGIGETITYIDLPVAELPLLIIAPMFPVTAKWCYQHLDPADFSSVPKKMDDIIAAFSKRDWQALAGLIENDLEKPVKAKFPVMEMIKRKALNAGALGIQMSGSGPTLFAICESKDRVLEVKKLLQQELPEEFEFYC